MLEVVEYLDADGNSPFGRWFGKLNNPAAARITIVLARIERGLLSNVKSVGGGVQELRIDTGPGYRIYFGREGDALVILLAGGTKSARPRISKMQRATGRTTANERKRRARPWH